MIPTGQPALAPAGSYHFPQGQGGYPASSGRIAVPARAGGIPVLATGIARGARPEESPLPSQAPTPSVTRAEPVREPLRESVSSSIAIPSYEEISKNATAPSRTPSLAPIDWTATQRRLSELGAVRFAMEKLPQGGSRFSFWVPSGSGLRPYQADGTSDAEAVRLCLAQVTAR